MTFRRSWAYGICAVLTLCLLLCCTALPGSPDAPSAAGQSIAWRTPALGKITVLFFREANYTGGGRIHLLKVDGRVIGELTADNYYRLEFWPGEYQFTVFLPSENFFGQNNPPMSISERVRFGPDDAGSVFGYQFTDGMGRGGFERRRLMHPPALIANRALAGNLNARETAQVTAFLNARYDGPAVNGRPHGIGSLAWPDGSVYQGVFEHGRPTDNARFVFSDGQVFMGLFEKGRPKSPGVLMTPDGHIVFAGDFADEKPNGIGLRTGKENPEFCVYDHGRDITKTFRQLAQEDLDAEDEARIQFFTQRIDRLRAQIEAARERLFKLKTADSTDLREHGADRTAELESSIRKLEFTRANMERTATSDLKHFTEELYATRWEREPVKALELIEDHRDRVEEERIWCQEEFALGRRPCGCAPLSDDFPNWQTCEASVGVRP